MQVEHEKISVKAIAYESTCCLINIILVSLSFPNIHAPTASDPKSTFCHVMHTNQLEAHKMQDCLKYSNCTHEVYFIHVDLNMQKVSLY